MTSTAEDGPSFLHFLLRSEIDRKRDFTRRRAIAFKLAGGAGKLGLVDAQIGKKRGLSFRSTTSGVYLCPTPRPSCREYRDVAQRREAPDPKL